MVCGCMYVICFSSTSIFFYLDVFVSIVFFKVVFLSGRERGDYVWMIKAKLLFQEVLRSQFSSRNYFS
jgi:hypothetical protein